ncbi:MAG TPA: PIN domain nuclease [Xanthomonadaceae bacterium]|nr:PIN domain nuclease [Xanthomonadaceae bacterium]
MILVDSSVWIDYFRGTPTPRTDMLDALLGSEPVVTGDLILTEVLQGFASKRDFNIARKLLTSLDIVNLAGRDIAIQAAKNFRVLRTLGITVRKTIDTVIATRCIESGFMLLYSDKDFDPFVQHLGLRSAYPGT